MTSFRNVFPYPVPDGVPWDDLDYSQQSIPVPQPIGVDPVYRTHTPAGVSESTERKYNFKVGDIVVVVENSCGGDKTGLAVITDIQNPDGEEKIFKVDFLDNTMNGWSVQAGDIRLATEEEINNSGSLNEMNVVRVEEEYHQSRRAIYDDLTKEILGFDSQIEGFRTEIYGLFKKRISLVAYLNSRKAKEKHPTNVQSARALISSLLGNKYEVIKFKGLSVIATTKPIVIHYLDDSKRAWDVPMGMYVINIYERDIKIENMQGEGRVFNGHAHPHLHSNGRPCFGSFSDKIDELFSEGGYLGVLDTLHDFLSSYDRHGAYRDVRYWLKDAESRCTKCWELKRKCRCHVNGDGNCEHCGFTPDEGCTCLFCPRTGEFVNSDGSYDEQCINECSAFGENEGGERRCREL